MAGGQTQGFAELDCRDYLQHTLNMIKQVRDSEQRAELCDTLEAFDIKVQKYNKAMAQLVSTSDPISEKDIIKMQMDDVREQFGNIVSGITDESVTGVLSDLLKKVREESDDNEEEDDLVSNLVYANKDPISKKKIKNPVRNKHCMHVYDEEVIKRVMSTKAVTCPVAGCKNDKSVQDAHLEPFPEFFNLCKK